MAFGVLPPFNPLLVTKAFFEALTQMDYIDVHFENTANIPSAYTFAQTIVNTDHSEPLCEKDFTIMGTAANNYLTVPANIADKYLHTMRIIQGICFGYGWPYSRDQIYELLEDDEYNFFILFFGFIHGIPGAEECLDRMGLAKGGLYKQCDRESMLYAELQPTIQSVRYKLGEIIRNECQTKKTTIASSQPILLLFAKFEQASLK